MKSPQVSIVMGSDSDYSVMQEAEKALEKLKIEYELSVVSAHRTPYEMVQFAEKARSRGVRVIIAGAGGAAHLPGMIAAITELPVIGVPVPVGAMNGQDALYSIVQMPRGVPVATVAIGNAWNAGILAAQILGAALQPNEQAGKNENSILDRVLEYKRELRDQILAKKIPNQ